MLYTAIHDIRSTATDPNPHILVSLLLDIPYTYHIPDTYSFV